MNVEYKNNFNNWKTKFLYIDNVYAQFYLNVYIFVYIFTYNLSQLQ